MAGRPLWPYSVDQSKMKQLPGSSVDIWAASKELSVLTVDMMILTLAKKERSQCTWELVVKMDL